MKLMWWMLLVFLGLTVLIQLAEGIASIADPAAMMAGLNRGLELDQRNAKIREMSGHLSMGRKTQELAPAQWVFA